MAVNKRPPAFQFYPKDWLASPSVRCMPNEAKGIYIMLLASAWDSDPVATLPSDDDELRLLSGSTEQEWTNHREKVLRNFEPYESGRLVNARLRQQYEELVAFSRKQSENGSKAKGKPKRSQNEAYESSASASASSTSTPNINEEERTRGGGMTESEPETFVAEDIPVTNTEDLD